MMAIGIGDEVLAASRQVPGHLLAAGADWVVAVQSPFVGPKWPTWSIRVR